MARFFSTVLLIAGVWPPFATALAPNPGNLHFAPRLSYSVSGLVRDTRGQPVRAARVEVIAPGFEGRFVLSDGDGRYRIPDLLGGVQLHASRDGYFSNVRAVATTDDAIVDFVLQPLRRLPIEGVIRDVLTTDYPRCFGHDYEDTGPEPRGLFCHRFLVTALADGTLDVVLTRDRSDALALDLIAPDGRSIQSWDRIGQTTLKMPVDKGSTYEVRVLGDRRTLGAHQGFELRTALR